MKSRLEAELSRRESLLSDKGHERPSDVRTSFCGDEIVATVRARATGVHLFVKPITGRPPEVLPIYDPAYWERFPEARARDFVRFLALAKRGGPYEGHVVTEDLYGKPVAPQFLSAVQYQQRDHVERGVAYARKTLGLGIRHRASK